MSGRFGFSTLLRLLSFLANSFDKYERIEGGAHAPPLPYLHGSIHDTTLSLGVFRAIAVASIIAGLADVQFYFHLSKILIVIGNGRDVPFIPLYQIFVAIPP